MPNWVYTKYIFKSKEKEPILDFNNKLLTLNNYSFELDYIITHSGLVFDDDDEFDEYPACRGTIETIGKVKETDYRGEHFFYFSVSTRTAWIEMPKMWQLIIEKLYSGKIEFGFLAEEENYDFVHVYNPDILRSTDSIEEGEYWLDHYFEYYDIEELKWLDNYGGKITLEELADIFSRILNKKIAKEDIKDYKNLMDFVSVVNKILKNVNNNFYFKIVEIEEISPSNFE